MGNGSYIGKAKIDEIVSYLPSTDCTFYYSPNVLDFNISKIRADDIPYLCSKLLAKNALIFHFLCSGSFGDTLKTLLPYFDVNILDGHGRNAIFNLVQRDRKTIVDLLIPVSDIIFDKHGNGALCYARSPKITTILIQNGYAVNSEHPKNSPLIHSLKNYYQDCAKVLIENGANVNIIHKYTPLMYAFKIYNHASPDNIKFISEIIDLLFLKGARIDDIYAYKKSDKYFKSVLSIAIGKYLTNNLNPYIVKLLSMGYIPNFRDVANALLHSTIEGFLYVLSCTKRKLLEQIYDANSGLVQKLWTRVINGYSGCHCPYSELGLLLSIMGDIRNIKDKIIIDNRVHRLFVRRLDPKSPSLFDMVYTTIIIDDHRLTIRHKF